MAGQTTWNKATVPAGTDPWNAVPDVKKGIETAGLVFSVANTTERGGLAALAPGGVLPIPTLVWRVDIAAYESWDGTAWRFLGGKTQTFNRGAGTDSTFTGANTGLVSGTLTAAPAGLWRIEAQLGLYGSTSAIGRTFVSTGSSPTYYKRRQDLTSTPSTYAVSTIFLHTGGDLVIAGGYDVTSGTASVMAAASGESSVTATYLGS